MSRYGTVALFALMALPLPVPKLPALAFAGIYRLPIVEVGLAIWAGKILKYSAYSYGTVRFPALGRGLI
jgi:membrane protein YqaA with SNARE-associated domain